MACTIRRRRPFAPPTKLAVAIASSLLCSCATPTPRELPAGRLETGARVPRSQQQPEREQQPEPDARVGEGVEGDGGYRPVQLEHLRIRTPYTLDPGRFEVELVSGYFDFDEEDVATVVAEVEYGLAENLLFELAVPAEWIDGADGTTGGISDVAVELKYGLPTVASTGLDSAIGVEVFLPTGDEDRGLGRGEVVWELFTEVARDFGEVSLFGGFLVGLEEGESAEYKVDAAVDWGPWSHRTRLELATNVEFGSGRRPAVSLVPGLEVELAELSFGEFALGLGFPVGLNSEAENWGVIVNLELEF